MSEIKSNVIEYNGKIVTVRGKIAASYGNTFYLMEGKTGFYVYNMNALETTGDHGDGFENGRVLLNETVLVTDKVDNGSYGLQLVGYSNGEFIVEACVLKFNTIVTDPVLYEIKNEGDLMSLSASPKLAGSRTNITGKFIKGKDNVTLEINTLTGKNAGQATITAKVGNKQSMPIEIIIIEAASTSSTISTIRDMSIGAEVTAVSKVLAFYGNGLAIQDEIGYLFCIIDGEFNPMEIKIGDTIKATGVRYNYLKREIPTINNCQFEIIEKKEIQTEYVKVNQFDFKSFTDEELKYGKAIEVNLTVDKQVKVSGISKAGGYFVNDESDEAGIEYFFWGKKYIQPLQTSKVKAILYKKGVTAIGKPSYGCRCRRTYRCS